MSLTVRRRGEDLSVVVTFPRPAADAEKAAAST
jgi:hypothetical protein